MANIKTFKKYDEVTRVEPAKELQSNKTDLLGSIFFGNFSGSGGGDRSYIGSKLIFMGIANGCAYFKRNEQPSWLTVDLDKLIELQLNIYSEGWEFYFDPKKMLEDDYHYDGSNLKNDINTLNQTDIQTQIEKAIKEENYELAEELKKKLL